MKDIVIALLIFSLDLNLFQLSISDSDSHTWSDSEVLHLKGCAKPLRFYWIFLVLWGMASLIAVCWGLFWFSCFVFFVLLLSFVCLFLRNTPSPPAHTYFLFASEKNFGRRRMFGKKLVMYSLAKEKKIIISCSSLKPKTS